MLIKAAQNSIQTAQPDQTKPKQSGWVGFLSSLGLGWGEKLNLKLGWVSGCDLKPNPTPIGRIKKFTI